MFKVIYLIFKNLYLMGICLFFSNLTHAEEINWLSFNFGSMDVESTGSFNEFSLKIQEKETITQNFQYGRVLSPDWDLTLSVLRYADQASQTDALEQNLSAITDTVFDSFGFLSSGGNRTSKLSGDAIRLGINYKLNSLMQNQPLDIYITGGLVASFHKLNITGQGIVLNNSNPDYRPGPNAVLPDEELIRHTEKFTNANFFYGLGISHYQSLGDSLMLRFDLSYLIENIELELNGRTLENKYEHLSLGIGIAF